MAARSVLGGVALDRPKSGVDEVEMIRMLKGTKDSAMKARTQAVNQMKALIVTAPVDLRAKLRDMNTSQLVACCARWHKGCLETPTAAARYALRSLARRHAQLTQEIEAIDAELARLVAAFAPLGRPSLSRQFVLAPIPPLSSLTDAGSPFELPRQQWHRAHRPVLRPPLSMIPEMK
jgi:hypothetical protein